ncbi:MAG: DUF3137 domain-containing protein [Candidatus Gastranaerophilales bacterium]|nr:DUF3137 domain-containing protein [Candidatus Gastranaerophilales bacterium]
MQDNIKDLKKSISGRDFFKFCKKEFSNTMQNLERTRKFYIWAVAFVVFVLACYITFVVLVYTNSNACIEKFGDVCLLFVHPQAIAIIVGILFTIINLLIKNYKTKAKQYMLPKLLSFIGNFNLEQDGQQDYEYVSNLGLFNSFNRYNCDDKLTGAYNTLNIKILELDLKHESGSGKHRTVVTIFQGILVIFPCLKKYTGTTYIFRNSLFPNFKGKRVHLESPEFEELYDVYSTDQIEARYLVTAAFMQRLVDLEKKGFNGITMSFERGNVNIAIPSNKDWFEVPLLKSAYDIDNYRSILIEILNLLSVIDSLKLDKNIGL